MHGGPTFADVLEATLGAHAEVPPSRAQWSNRPITPPLFVFGDTGHTGQRHVHPVSYDSALFDAPSHGPTSYAATEEPPAWRVQPAPIVLAPHEQEALAALNVLGAGLDEGLSPTDLRRAFRRLAHRYHPDRHPGSSHTEQERLARLFAEMTDHYRLLWTALNTRATCH